MATTMHAVETFWILEYHTPIVYREIIQMADQIPGRLRAFQKRGIEKVKMTEVRTCTALPGLEYRETSEIDLTEVIIKAAAIE